MKTQTVKQMVNTGGATREEAYAALSLFALLRPGLKIKRNGDVETELGEKTPLGLYRVIRRHSFLIKSPQAVWYKEPTP